MSLPENIESVYLIGLMGAGKSTVGKLLAKVLNWEFLDLDHEIEIVCGKDIPSIFNEEGEKEFRKHETRALLDTEALNNVVVACGGGVVTRTENIEFLAGKTTIWLELSPAEAAIRLEHSSKRPLLEGCEDTFRELNTILLNRQAAYADAATIHVNSGGLAPELITSNVLKALEQRND